MGSLGPLDGVYLGRSRLSTTISWHPHATGHALITNEALTAYNDAHTRYLQLSNGGDDDGNHNDDGEETPSPPEPATLCILARISRDGTFVAPDGRYGQGFQRKFEKPFEKTQLNFTLECLSEYPKLAAEFDKAVDRLKSLFADADPTKTRPRAGVIADSNAATAQESQSVPVRIKLRHVVFAVSRTVTWLLCLIYSYFAFTSKPRTEENETIAEGSLTFSCCSSHLLTFEMLGLPAECSIEHWPVDEPAKAALKQLQSTHVAQPLNAYDTDGNLILPSRYDRLRGAICAVRFNVLHYTMADGDKSQNKMADGGKRQNKLKDVFVADVVGISVIHSAPLPSTPKKRVSISDPYSPSKKKKNT